MFRRQNSFKVLVKRYMILLFVLSLCVTTFYVTFGIIRLSDKDKMVTLSLLKHQSVGLETRINTSKMLFEGIFNDDSIRDYADFLNNPVDNDRYGEILIKVMNNLNRENSTWSVINIIPSIISENDAVISINGTSSKKDFFKQIGLYEFDWNGIYENFLYVDNDYSSKTYITSNHIGNLVMITSRKVNKMPICSVALISMENVRQEKGYDAFSLVCDGNVLISGNNIENDYFDGVGEYISEIPSNREYLKWKGELFCFSVSRLSPDLIFLQKTDFKNYFQNAIIVAVEGVFILILLIAICYIFIFKKADVLIRLFERLINTFKEYNSEIVENDVSSLYMTAKNIVKDNQSYKNEIQMSRQAVKKQFLHDWVYGLLPEEIIKEKIEFFQLDLLSDGCRVVIISQQEENYVHRFDNHKKILEVVTDVAEKYGGEFFEKDLGELVFLFPISDDEVIKDVMSKTISEVSDVLELEFNVSIGVFEKNVADIRKSFEGALVLNEKRSSTNIRELFNGDTNQKSEAEYVYPLEIEKNLIFAAVNGEKENAKKIFSNVICRNIKEKTLDNYSLLEFEILMLSSMRRILSLVGIPEKKIFGDVVLFPLEIQGDSDKAINRLEELFDKIIEKICFDDSNNVTFSKVLNYVKNNYSRDISRADIAREFNISESYVGKLFASEYDTNFKSFLNRLRISKAQEIMDNNPEIPISDIPGLVGFNHSVSFLRSFKKYTGMSPTEYKRHDKKNGEEN